MIQNKALWIFPNMKESVDILPQRLRGKAWEMIINYAFGDENVEQSCKNIKVLLVFRALKPLLRLRGIAGSQNGKSNNPSGLAKDKQPNIGANIGANITPNPLITETITETNNNITETIIKELSDKFSLREGQFRIDYNFSINSLPEIEIYRREVGDAVLLSVQSWLIDKKFGEIVDKEFICKQIVNFSKRRGLI